MKKKMMAVGLAAVLVMSLVSCGNAEDQGAAKKEVKAEQISNVAETKTEKQPKENVVYGADFKESSMDFALELLKACYSKEENMMLSPVSVLAALSMTANGADGETLLQMEQVLANGLDIEKWNQELSAYINSGLPSSEDAKLSIANSIWFLDDEELSVNQDFLDINSETYQAEIYKAAFDEQTLKDINNWVSNKTDGMIKDILDKIPEDAVMYLINAVTFDAKWKNMYFDYQVHENTFTTEAGEERLVPMMRSDENWYLEDELATGFRKPYQEGYSFVALLPKEGTTVEEYINSLEAESFCRLLEEEQDILVHATLPKFTSEYKNELSDVLMAAGMKDAFDGENANFLKLGTSTEGNIFISRVLHKTFISVDEAGTRAGAATSVEMTTESGMEILDDRTVVLDRPFIYAIIDDVNKLPVFIGSVMNIE